MTYLDPKTPCGKHLSSASIVPATAAVPAALFPVEPGQTVICGDALDVMAAMPGASIDVVVTSPPYNIGIDYRSYDDRKIRSEYLDWMDATAAGMTRVLRDNGAAFINLGAGPDPWQMMDVAERFRAHLQLQNSISWIKSITVDDVTRGHVRPINSSRYLNRTHEQILHFTKRGDVAVDRLAIGVPYTDKSNLKRWRGSGQDLRCGGSAWFIPYETTSSRRGEMRHPAPFPVELPRRCLKMHGRKGLVLDPFLGSGTTLVAAKQLGWSGIGIEIDPVYADMARTRIAAAEASGQS